MSSKTPELLERSRQELLDLSTRNRLLSIPVHAKSARIIQVHDELSQQVFRILVAEKNEFSFLPGQKTKQGASASNTNGETPTGTNDEEVSLPQPDDAEDPASGLAKRHVDSRLQTALTSETLQRRLLAFHRDARTMIEEQGVNILYLALGHLKWFEADQAETPRYAPLILVPVELHRQTASEKFHLSWLEEDLQENLSLAAKLKADFGTELPPFPDGDEFSPTEYFDAVAKTITGAKKWEVLPNAITLGFFSFAKFLMYRDLDPDNWPNRDDLLAHAFVTGLLQDGFPHAAPVLSDSIHLDELVPAARLDHVVDADSSQTLAIESARQGCSFVIQGPPGTGKSQSITNIISTAVLDGKKVLFVAEKLAALEVVKRRLEKEGLGPLCLELHSNKCKKRVVIEEIGRTWKLGRPKSAESGVIVSSLEKRRGVLNSHAAALHERHLPSGLTPFVIIGHLALLNDRGREVAELTFSGAELWSPHDRMERRRLAEELVAHVEQIGLPVQNPWRGVCRELVLRIDLVPLENRIRSVHELLGELIEVVTELAGHLSLPAPTNFPEVQEQHAVAACVAKSPPLDRKALADAVWDAGPEPMRSLLAKGRGFTTATAQVRSLNSQLPGIANDRLNCAKNDLRSLADHLDGLRKVSSALASDLALSTPRGLAQVAAQRTTAECIAHAPPLDRRALGSDAWTSGPDALRNLLVKGREFAAATARIAALTDEQPRISIARLGRADSALHSLTDNLNGLRETSITLASNLSQPPPSNFAEVEQQRLCAEWVAQAPPLDKTALCNELWDAGPETVRVLLGKGHEFVAATAKARALTGELPPSCAERPSSAENALRSLAKNISELRETSSTLASHLFQPPPRDFSKTAELRTVAEYVSKAPLVDKEAICNDRWDANLEALRSLLDEGRKLTTAVDKAGKQVTEAAWASDFTDARAQIAAHGRSWLRFLNSDYRRAIAQLRSAMTGALPRDHTKLLAFTDEIISGQRALRAVRSADPLGISAFGSLWRREKTDWAQAKAVFDWVIQLDEAGLRENFRRVFAAVEDQQAVGRLVKQLSTQLMATIELNTQFFREFSIDCLKAFGTPDSSQVPLEVFPWRFAEWISRIQSLAKWQAAGASALSAIQDADSAGQSAFGTLWRREESDWNQLEAISAWLSQSPGGGSAISFRRMFADVEDQQSVGRLAKQLSAQSKPTMEIALQFLREFDLDCLTAFGAPAINQVPLEVIAQRCSGWLSRIQDLLRWKATAESASSAIREGDSLGQSAFGTFWHSAESDWSQLEAILNWLARSSVTGMEADFRRIAAGVQDQQRVARLAVEVGAQSKTVRDEIDMLLQKLDTDCTAAFSVSNTDQVDVESLAGWLVKTESLLRWSNEAQCALTAIRNGNSIGQSAFGTIWRGEETNWDQVEAILDWLKQSAVAGMGASFRRLCVGVQNRDRVASLVQEIGAQSGTTCEEAGQLFKELRLDCSAAFAAADLSQVPLAALADRCSLWLSQMEGLSGWNNYLVRARRACQLGLASFVARLETGAVQPKAFLNCFDRIYYGQLLRDITKHKPELAQFDGVLHEKNVTEFRRLDKERLTLAKQRTLITHFENLPPSNAAIGPAGIVRSEMERKRGHRAVRRLLKDAGSVVQAIKPVFMMSPLSIAQFLEPGAVEFDLLVIDEASQVQPVDALGAIARCKQIVVVGDSKQLPPTRFFTRLTTDSDEPEDEEDQAPQSAEAKDIESILGLCSARGLPQTMLRWHYRSRHHSLIAVSNQEFYENRLFIVPSPYSDAPGLGLKFNHVPEGVFDAGGSGTNRVEAKAVCRAIIEHARKSPHVTLGVAAFSVRQQQAILDELEFLRRENADTEPFFSGNPIEPFFVKNLENVQGDERDVIFISVGYGRDANGKMAMRFGPLSSDGGERRLNVLISRAKKRCEVFSSITSDDIDLERASGRGVAAFKVFLSFARTGCLGISTVARGEEASPFEEAVRQAVEALGYEVHTQIGLAGFFIDLSVVDREHPGRYLLGIECDGAHYHSSRCARDRDRLRQAVLEDHGWIIHRIWSTDWFQRPVEQLRKVANAIASAKLTADANNRLEVAQVKPSPAPEPTEDLQRETGIGDEVSGINALTTPYREARFAVPSQVDPHKLAKRDMAEILLRIVKQEGPIHEDEVVTRVRDLWGLGRAGNRIQDAVDQAVRFLLVSQECTREDGFLNIPGAPVPIRRRELVDSPNLRKPEFLPPTEIRAAILAVIEAHHGAAEPEIPTAVTRLFGFKSTGSQLRLAIETQTAKLWRQGIIEKSNGMLKRAEKGEPPCA